MSHGYPTVVHSIAFDQAWNPYTSEDDWSHYASKEINENLPDFDENVLEQFIHENEAAMMSPDSQMHVTSSAHSPLAEQILVSSPSHTQSSAAVPVCTPYPGDFGFIVTLEKQQKKTKSANWIYYPDLHKLFVKINKPCPFLFKTVKKPPSGSIIRALPVFLNPEHIQEVVSRCPTHKELRNSNESPVLAQHMVLSEHQLARHVEDGYTHRLSVIIPYEDPQAGAEWVTNLYKFMCFSSCHSGYSRRPLHVIFTLECDGLVLGRQVIKVRCCASPGRDGCQEEESLLGKKSNKRKIAPDDLAALMPDIKRQRPGGGKRDEVFTIQVRGRENYETLRQLRDSLELVEQLPAEVIAHFKWQQMELDRWCLPDEHQTMEDMRLALSPTTMVPAPSAPAALAPPTLPAPTPVPPSGKVKKRMTSSPPSASVVSAFEFPATVPPSFAITSHIPMYF